MRANGGGAHDHYRIQELTVHRFVLTGPPGAGKTSVLRELARRGHAVVEEAATAVIHRGFPSRIGGRSWRTRHIGHMAIIRVSSSP